MKMQIAESVLPVIVLKNKCVPNAEFLAVN